MQFQDAARSWRRVGHGIARVASGCRGSDPRLVVANLEGGRAGHLHERLYCARGQAEMGLAPQTRRFPPGRRRLPDPDRQTRCRGTGFGSPASSVHNQSECDIIRTQNIWFVHA